tara:strand:+ start:309 stop:662 length:354 start_codon:yes stop_codon:yes gene_type:complete
MIFFLKYYFFSKGAPSFFFSSKFSSFGAGFTSPFIVKIVGFLLALVVRVMVFVNLPTLLVAYFTPIDAVSPDIIGSLGHSGTVHPQLPFAFLIINGSEPLFVNINSPSPFPLYSITP